MPQHFQSVHIGHFDVQRDHVRIELRDPLQSNGAVGWGPHYLDHCILLQGSRDQPADDHEAVHSHHAYPIPRLEQPPVHYGHGYSLATGRIPTNSSFSLNMSFVKGFMTYSFAPASRADTTWSTSVSVVTMITFTDANSGL